MRKILIAHQAYEHKLGIVSTILLIALFLSFRDDNYHAHHDSRLQEFESSNHFEISWINNEIYEVKDILTNFRSLYRLSYPRQSLDEDTVDQFIDLSEYNPDDYAHMYSYQTTFALGNSSSYPMVISDVDSNGLIELAGLWYNDHSIGFSRSAIYEQQNNGTFLQRRLFLDDSIIFAHTYGDVVTDLDNDNLYEINVYKAAGTASGPVHGVANFEADSIYTLPDSLNFISDSLNGYSGSLRIVDLDQDGIKECMGFAHKAIFIAEYNSLSNKFEKTYSFNTPQDHIYNFGIGDGDIDGKTDFICGSIYGNVYIFENVSDNQYELVWTDTLPYSNANLSAATDDIDQNGKPEFFIGFDGYYQGYAGTDIYWYESVADNIYERKRRIFIVDTGFYSENGLHNYDMDGDDIDELVFDFGLPSRMFILQWNVNGFFDLYYYSHVSDYRELEAVTVYRPNGQINPDIIFSTYYYPELPVHQSHYYKFNPTNSIDETLNLIPKEIELRQNFPNPFNSMTLIKFRLNKKDQVTLSIFDITGREIKTLYQGTKSAGDYSVFWDGSNNSDQQVGSGIYFYRLKTASSIQTKKMALIR